MNRLAFMKKQSMSKNKLEINKKNNLWWILGIIFSSFYALFNFVLIFTNAFSNLQESGMILFILTGFINFPCLITNTTRYVCLSIGIVTYFLIGALIGFLVYKIKKK